MNLSYEYNEYVIGYVVTDLETGRTCNFQFDQIQSNHPTPDFALQHGCEGDDTYTAFSDEELQEMRTWLRGHEEVDALEDAYTAAYYADETGDFPSNIWNDGVAEWQIIEAAKAA